jgi:hypothetical protein
LFVNTQSGGALKYLAILLVTIAAISVSVWLLSCGATLDAIGSDETTNDEVNNFILRTFFFFHLAIVSCGGWLACRTVVKSRKAERLRKIETAINKGTPL